VYFITPLVWFRHIEDDDEDQRKKLNGHGWMKRGASKNVRGRKISDDLNSSFGQKNLHTCQVH
jgi:hypothetical protein